jgi:hypothetical protein
MTVIAGRAYVVGHCQSCPASHYHKPRQKNKKEFFNFHCSVRTFFKFYYQIFVFLLFDSYNQTDPRQRQAGAGGNYYYIFCFRKSGFA